MAAAAAAAAAARPAKSEAAVGVWKGPDGCGSGGSGEERGGFDGSITDQGNGGGGDGGDDGGGRVSGATPRPANETGSRPPPDPAALLLPAGASGVGAGPRVPPGRFAAVDTAQQVNNVRENVMYNDRPFHAGGPEWYYCAGSVYGKMVHQVEFSYLQFSTCTTGP